MGRACIECRLKAIKKVAAFNHDDLRFTERPIRHGGPGLTAIMLTQEWTRESQMVGLLFPMMDKGRAPCGS